MAVKPVNVHLDFLGANQIKNVLLDVRSADPGTPAEGQFWYNSTSFQFKFRDNGTTQVVGTSGGGLTNAYATITDGSVNATAVTADTFKLRTAGTGLSVAVQNNDGTHGDNALFTLNSGLTGNSVVVLTTAGGKITASLIQEVIALADLTDVTATTGTGTTVVLNGSPVIVTPTIASFVNANHTHLNAAGGGTLTAAAVSDFDTQVRTSRLDQMAVPTASVSLNSQKITNLATPTTGTDAATMAYVDGLIEGRDWKQSVRVATTAAGTLATSFENGDVIDGVTLATGNRILLKDQAAPAENGIYVVAASGAPTRATDADSSADVTGGFAVWVNEGTANADTGWVLTTNDPITLGSTSLTFTQNSGLGQVTAGAGMTKTGNTLDVATAATTRIVVNADNIDLGQPTISGGAAGSGFSLVTVDVYGRVTNTGEIIAANGIPARTAAGTFSARTITGTTNFITVTNGDGVAGNPTITVSSTYAGGTSIASLGTVTAGTWNATVIGLLYGGTGIDASTGAGAGTARDITHLGRPVTAPANATNVVATAKGIYTGVTFVITGTGAATAFTLTHNLNNTTPIIGPLLNGSTGAVEEAAVVVTDANTVTVTFNTAVTNAATYRIAIAG